MPSHTFSTTPIDVDKDYHKASDEAETLNMTVITQTIQAVAKGTESIINGKDTPTRVVLKREKISFKTNIKNEGPQQINVEDFLFLEYNFLKLISNS